MRHQFPSIEWTPEQQKDLELAMKPEGLNPSIHCSLTRGIAHPQEPQDLEKSLDKAIDSAVDLNCNT